MADFSQYEKDESGYRGKCTQVFHAQESGDIEKALRSDTRFVAQGGCTGIAGACVPDDCAVLDMSMLKGCTGFTKEKDGYTIELLAGTTLEEFRTMLRLKRIDFTNSSDIRPESKEAIEIFKQDKAFVFAPDPTEETATIGGLFSTNACGPSTMLFGSFSSHVLESELMLASGSAIRIKRGDNVFDSDGCCIVPDGGIIKTAPGYDARDAELPLLPAPGKDLLDLFTGSEGMLGVVHKLRLKLTEAPKEDWRVLLFHRDEEAASVFADDIYLKSQNWDACRLSILEYMDKMSIKLIGEMRGDMSSLNALPELPQDTCCIMVGIRSQSGEGIDDALDDVLELSEAAGFSDEDIWAAETWENAEMFRLLRHGIPEAANSRMNMNKIFFPQAVKIAADVRFGGDDGIANAIENVQYLINNERVPAVVFAHLGRLHFHINFLPESKEEMERCLLVHDELNIMAKGSGGSGFAENGIGKIKKNIAKTLLPSGSLGQMRAVKEFFDPKNKLNPGNMLL